MRKGSLPRSIARALPEPVGYDFAPDGLDLAAIDELIEQAYTDARSRPRPVWLSSDVTEQRRARRTVRQIVRALPESIGFEPATDDAEAA
jgi:hypothetical protein